jgi:hypothetical protein
LTRVCSQAIGYEEDEALRWRPILKTIDCFHAMGERRLKVNIED